MAENKRSKEEEDKSDEELLQAVEELEEDLSLAKAVDEEEEVIMSHWDILPVEIQRKIQWLAVREHVHDRVHWKALNAMFDPCDT